MIRVLNVLFDDRYGGPQKRVVEVARKLSQQVETILCLPDRGGNAAEIAAQAGLPVRRIKVEAIPRRPAVQLDAPSPCHRRRELHRQQRRQVPLGLARHHAIYMGSIVGPTP